MRRRWEELGLGAGRELEAFAALLRTRHLVNLRVDEALATVGLTNSRATVLITLDCAPDRSLTIGQLSRRTLAHPSSVTPLVDHLAQAGLVRRRVPDHDRRSVVVTLTRKGQNLLRKASSVLVDIRFGLNALDAEELDQLIASLDAIRTDLIEERSGSATTGAVV